MGSTFLSSGPCYLWSQNLLLVPHLEKNLILVKKSCEDNNVIVEFFSSSFSIKDEQTMTTILVGAAKDGLYQLPLKDGS